jgi:hypothetical protein
MSEALADIYGALKGRNLIYTYAEHIFIVRKLSTTAEDAITQDCTHLSELSIYWARNCI